MKKLDNKKIILLVVLILAIALVIFLAIKQSSKKKDGKLANDEETKIAETATIDYITKLTYGQGTAYNGLDLLYNRDSVTYDDLTVGNILTTAFEYAVNNSESEVSNTVINALKNDGFNTDNMTIISGSSIRNAIKKIFGVDFDNKDYSAGINYKFQYFYNSEFDVYLRSTTELAVNTDNTYLLYKIIKTTTSNNKLNTEIAVAYVYNYNNKYYFTKDANNKEKVYESDKLELQEDKLNEFEHFTITLKKINDDYVFEKISKNK